MPNSDRPSAPVAGETTVESAATPAAMFWNWLCSAPNTAEHGINAIKLRDELEDERRTVMRLRTRLEAAEKVVEAARQWDQRGPTAAGNSYDSVRDALRDFDRIGSVG